MSYVYTFLAGCAFYNACVLGFRDGDWPLAAVALVASSGLVMSAMSRAGRTSP